MSDDESRMLVAAKSSLIAVVGFVTLAASAAPWLIARYVASRRALDLIATASAASAGIVIGAFLCHIMPEASASFADYLAATYPEGDTMIDYPFAGAVCGGVLALLVSLDALIVRRGVDGSDGHAHGGGHHNHVSDGIDKFVSMTRTDGHAHEVKPTGAALKSPSTIASEASGDFGPVSARAGDELSPVAPAISAYSNGYGTNLPVTALPKGSEQLVANEQLLEQITASTAHVPHAAAVSRAYIFFAALSLHGIFDGLSIGSETSAEGFASTTVAVVGHKLFDGLSLGCALFPANLPVMHRMLLLVTSSMTTPLGIGIGMAAEAAVDGASARLVNGIVLSMAAGSFVFISLMELLPSSLADGRWVLGKLAVFVLGLLGMAVLAAYV